MGHAAGCCFNSCTLASRRRCTHGGRRPPGCKPPASTRMASKPPASVPQHATRLQRAAVRNVTLLHARGTGRQACAAGKQSVAFPMVAFPSRPSPSLLPPLASPRSPRALCPTQPAPHGVVVPRRRRSVPPCVLAAQATAAVQRHSGAATRRSHSQPRRPRRACAVPSPARHAFTPASLRTEAPPRPWRVRQRVRACVCAVRTATTTWSVHGCWHGRVLLMRPPCAQDTAPGCRLLAGWGGGGGVHGCNIFYNIYSSYMVGSGGDNIVALECSGKAVIGIAHTLDIGDTPPNNNRQLRSSVNGPRVRCMAHQRNGHGSSARSCTPVQGPQFIGHGTFLVHLVWV